MTATAIQIEGLSKSFGEVQALAGIDLAIEQGKIYGLLGANGAGKTTLLRTLIGATRASAGKISVFGLDPARQKRDLRRQIGYMPQFPTLYEDLSARENVHFFGRPNATKGLEDQIGEVLRFVELEERADDAVFTFSGGMKQRASLACALVNQPKLLLLDEPTSGVDPQLRAAFWRRFKQLASEGVTVLVSTHQMDEAVHCDRLAIINKGGLLADDSPRNLLWKHRARVRLQRGTETQTIDLENYPDKLPQLLQEHGLAKDFTRIEIEEENLENIVLRLVEESAGRGKGRPAR